MLEPPDQEFRTTMMSKLRTVIDEVDSTREQMGNVSRDWKF